MKKTFAAVALFAVLVLILTPAVLSVNSTTTNGAPTWADGGVPAPPFPSYVSTWADGGVPAPPFPS